MQHAEDLFKRGINVLEDSSNWDWDESQQMTVSTSPTSFLILIRFSRCSQTSNEYKYIFKTFVSKLRQERSYASFWCFLSAVLSLKKFNWSIVANHGNRLNASFATVVVVVFFISYLVPGLYRWTRCVGRREVNSRTRHECVIQCPCYQASLDQKYS